MLTPYIDLHTHTSLSDGVHPPQEVIDLERAAGVRVLAITDHNHTADLTQLRAANPDMTLIQGAEVSCLYTASDGREVEIHVVALGFDPQNGDLRQVLAANRPDRRPYINAILDCLRQWGIDLGDYGTLREKFPESNHIGRMHIAKVMAAEGYVRDEDEAYEEYIGAFGARKAFVKSGLRYVPLERAVAAILAAGGIPVLCHLFYYKLDAADREALLRRFRELAGDCAALEAYYTGYDDAQREFLLEKCREYGLFPSAASDFHDTEELDNRYSHTFCTRLLQQLGIRLPE